MDWITLLLLSMAGHRLWFFWMTQRIFQTSREFIAGYIAAANCAVCTSAWVAMLIVGLWYWVPYGQYPVYTLAVCEGLGLLDPMIRRLEKRI